MGESQNTPTLTGAVLPASSSEAASTGLSASTASDTSSYAHSNLQATGRIIGLGLLDAAMLVVAFLAADLLRCTFWQQTTWPQPPIAEYQDWYWYLWALPALMLVWPASLAGLGFYRRPAARPVWRLPIEAAALLFLCFSALALFFSRLEYPRMLIVLTTVLALLSHLGGRLILAFAAHVSRWWHDVGLPNYEMYSQVCTSPAT